MTSGRIPGDPELLRRLRTDDRSAMQEVLDLYWPEMIAYATQIVGTADAAEDIAQAAFVRLWQRRKTWRDDGTVRHLLLRITRNLALNERRRRKRRAHWLGAQREHAQHDANASHTPLTELLGGELRVAVARALDALPERRREIFILRRYHGLTPREIASVLEISSHTVSNQLAAATAELRRALAAYLE